MSRRKPQGPWAELFKLRISYMVLVTAYLGFYLGMRSTGQLMTQFENYILLFHLLLEAQDGIPRVGELALEPCNLLRLQQGNLLRTRGDVL